MSGASIDSGRLRADLDALAEFGKTPSGGVDRTTFSPAFQEACGWLVERMHETGLEPRIDPAGNVIGRTGPEGPAVVAGSHIDSVPDGGRFDGALGVVAGLEVARAMRDSGTTPSRAFEVVAFSDEEGTYLSLFGSRAMTGKVSHARLAEARGPEDETLEQALRRVGFDPDRVGEAARPAADFAAYLELHIEQGPVLERRGLPIGVVDAIVGLDHADVRFRGQPAHAGTTPMGMRRDAFRGAARYASRAFDLVAARTSEAVRLTFGIVEAAPQVTNIVPYNVRLRQEIREASADAIDELRSATRELAERVAAEEGLEWEVEALSYNPPAAMSRRIRTLLGEACDARGYGWLEMPSGAGHDAQTMAGVCDSGLLFVSSAGGHSHRPDEHTSLEDAAKGAQVLIDAVMRLCA